MLLGVARVHIRPMALSVGLWFLVISSMAGIYSCCYVHPVVLVAVVDSYERRSEDARRVIGTLLGNLRITCIVGMVTGHFAYWTFAYETFRLLPGHSA